MEFLIRINYKSGHSIEAWFESFKWQKTGTSEKLNWKLSSQDPEYDILKIGVDDIESIQQLKTRGA